MFVNSSRFAEAAVQDRAQNIESIQKARILLSNPDSLKPLRTATNELKITQTEHSCVLHSLIANPTNVSLQIQHVELSSKIAGLEQKVETFMSDYYATLNDAQIAQQTLRLPPTTPEAQQFQAQIATAQQDFKAIAPVAFVSKSNAQITHILQSRAPQRVLQEAVAKYDQITHMSRFENPQFAQFITNCKDDHQLVKNKMDVFEQSFPKDAWHTFRTMTLPRATTVALQETARTEAANITVQLLIAMDNLKLQPLPSFILAEPTVDSWVQQLEWLVWSKVAEERIAWSLKEQQLYGIYISALLAQRALGTKIDDSLIVHARAYTAKLTQTQIKPRNQSPDFKVMWNLLLTDVNSTTALSSEDITALRETLGVVNMALSLFDQTEACVHDARQVVAVFLACASSACQLNNITQPCNAEIADLTAQLTALDNATQQSINTMKCDNPDACSELKMELLNSSRLQIEFFKKSLSVLKNATLLTDNNQEPLRMHLPANVIVIYPKVKPEPEIKVEPEIEPEVKVPEPEVKPPSLDPAFNQEQKIVLDEIAETLDLTKIVFGALQLILHNWPLFEDDKFVRASLMAQTKFIDTCEDTQFEDMKICLDKYTTQRKLHPELKRFNIIQDADTIAFASDLTQVKIGEFIVNMKNSYRKFVSIRKRVETSKDTGELAVRKSEFASEERTYELFFKIDSFAERHQRHIMYELLHDVDTLESERMPFKLPRAHCKPDLNQDLDVHSKSQRDEFTRQCESHGEDKCLDAIAKCPQFEKLVTNYNASKRPSVASSPQFAQHKTDALNAETLLEDYESKLIAAETKLERDFPIIVHPPIDDDVLASEEKSTQVLNDVIAKRDAYDVSISALNEFKQQYDDAQAELDRHLLEIDKLFPPLDSLVELSRQARILQERMQKSKVFVTAFLKFSPGMTDEFPLDYYAHMTSFIATCEHKATIAEQTECVDTYVLPRIKHPELSYVWNIAETDVPDLSNFEADLRDIYFEIDTYYDNKLTKIANVSAASTAAELTQYEIDVKTMTQYLDQDVEKPKKLIEQWAFKKNAHILNRMLKYANHISQLSSKEKVFAECEISDFVSDLLAHSRHQRQKFWKDCQTVGHSDECNDINNVDCKTRFIKVKAEYDSNKTDRSVIAASAKYSAMSNDVLQAKIIVDTKRVEFLQAEAQWKDFWKTNHLILPADFDTNAPDIAKALENSNIAYAEFKRVIESARLLTEAKDVKHQELKDASLKLDELMEALDNLEYEAYQVAPYIPLVSTCERVIPFNAKWAPASRDAIVTKCQTECPGEKEDVVRACVADKSLENDAKLSEVLQTASSDLDAIVTKLQQSQNNKVAVDSRLKDLMEEATFLYDSMVYNLDTSSKSDIDREKQFIVQTQNKITDAKAEFGVVEATHQTNLAEYDTKYNELVAGLVEPFGQAAFDKVLQPTFSSASKLPAICDTLDMKTILGRNTENTQKKIVEKCQAEIIACAPFPGGQCENDIVPNISIQFSPIILDEVLLAQKKSEVETAESVLKTSELDVKTAYDEWKNELKSTTIDRVKREQRSREFETKQTAYLQSRLVVLKTQTELDFEILRQTAPVQAERPNCSALFQAIRGTREIAWSISSRKKVLEVCVNMCKREQSACISNKDLELLTEAHAIDFSDEDETLKNELQQVEQKLQDAYLNAPALSSEINLLRQKIIQENNDVVVTTLDELIAAETRSSMLRRELEQKADYWYQFGCCWTAELEFSKVFARLTTKTKVNERAFEVYVTEFLNNPILLDFKNQNLNLTRRNTILTNFPPDDLHGVETIFAYFHDQKKTDAELQSLYDSDKAASTSRPSFDPQFTNKLQKDITMIKTMIANVQQDMKNLTDIEFVLEAFKSGTAMSDTSALQDPNNLLHFHNFVNHIATLTELIEQFSNTEANGLRFTGKCLNVPAGIFRENCMVQGCRDTEQCEAVEEFAQKLHDETAPAFTGLNPEQKAWLDQSLALRIPQELRIFALGPFANDFLIAYNAIREVLDKEVQFSEALKLSDDAMDSEKSAWKDLSTRYVRLMATLSVLGNVVKLQKRIKILQASQHASKLQDFINADIQCLNTLTSVLDNYDFLTLVSNIVKKPLAEWPPSQTLKKFGRPCYKSDRDVTDALLQETPIFINDFKKVKQSFITRFSTSAQPTIQAFQTALLSTSDDESLNWLQQELDKLLAQMDRGKDREDHDLLLAEALGQRPEVYMQVFKPHIENLLHIITQLRVIKAAIRDSDEATSQIAEPNKAVCAQQIKTKWTALRDNTETVQDIIYILLKLLQSTSPADAIFHYKQMIDFTPLLTCIP